MNVEISPLGPIAIAILVNCWNASKKIARKEFVRRLLLSGNTMQIHEALDDLFKIADENLHRTAFSYSHLPGGHGMQEILRINGDALGNHLSDEHVNKARGEIAHFFAEAFKAGYFEQIPVPKFQCTLPLEKLAAFQKFAAEQAEKLSDRDPQTIQAAVP
jgi:hypothetical protein